MASARNEARALSSFQPLKKKLIIITTERSVVSDAFRIFLGIPLPAQKVVLERP